MARGTIKRYFKKNKTRNNKKIRKQRRMKKSNKIRKRKQIKKSRKRKAGLKYYQLTKEQRNWLREQHLFDDLMMRDTVDEVTKHALANIAEGKAQRRRGFYTTYIKKPENNKEYLKKEKQFNRNAKKATKRYNEAETARKESVKKAAIEELYMTIQNAMNELNNNKSDEDTTILAIQNAIKIAQDKGVEDDDDAMKYAEKHLIHVYQKLEKFNIEHDLKVRKAREREEKENEWRRANRSQGKGLRKVKVDTEDDIDSESDYPEFDDDRYPDGGGDDNTPWYEGPTY